MVKHICKLSVHEFVDWVLEGGDLLFGSVSSSRMLEGIEVHIAFQKETAGQTEVAISYSQLSDLAAVALSGRIDVLHENDSHVVIEELKSTRQALASITEACLPHILQAKTYAAMYCAQHDIKKIETKITYISVYNQDTAQFSHTYTAHEALSWLRSCCEQILHETEIDLEHKNP